MFKHDSEFNLIIKSWIYTIYKTVKKIGHQKFAHFMVNFEKIAVAFWCRSELTSFSISKYESNATDFSLIRVTVCELWFFLFSGVIPTAFWKTEFCSIQGSFELSTARTRVFVKYESCSHVSHGSNELKWSSNGAMVYELSQKNQSMCRFTTFKILNKMISITS